VDDLIRAELIDLEWAFLAGAMRLPERLSQVKRIPHFSWNNERIRRIVRHLVRRNGSPWDLYSFLEGLDMDDREYLKMALQYYEDKPDEYDAVRAKMVDRTNAKLLKLDLVNISKEMDAGADYAKAKELLNQSLERAGSQSSVQDDTLTSDRLLQISTESVDRKSVIGFPAIVEKLPEREQSIFRKGYRVVIGGAESHGKTSLMMNIIAANPDAKTLYCCFEAVDYIIPQLAAIAYGKNALQCSRDELSRTADFYKDKLYVLSGPTRAKMSAAAKKINPDILVIDYIQLLSISSSNDPDDRLSAGVGKTMLDLQNEFASKGMCVFILSQLARIYPNKDGSLRDPQMSDLKESGYISQEADVVVLIKLGDAGDKMKIHIAKNKRGLSNRVMWLPVDSESWRVG